MATPKSKGVRAKIAVHTSYKELADGQIAIYAYASRGGPRLCHARGKTREAAKSALETVLGAPETLRRYSELCADAGASRTPRQRLLRYSIAEYFQSAEFENIDPSTRREYRRYLEDFRGEYAEFGIKVFEDPRSREDIYDFRELWRGKDRAADYAMQSLSAFFKWARARGWTSADPTAGIPRLYRSNRADKIWQQADLSRFERFASREVADVVWLGAYTGLRQVDLLNLTHNAIGDKVITVTASKRGKMETKPVLDDLRHRLSLIPKKSPTVLLNTHGKPWTSDGFRSSFDAARERAGITGLMFRDLRGTACTRFFRAGITNPHTLARFFGWSLASVEKLISVYVSPDALNQDIADWADDNSSLDMQGRMKQKRPLTNR